MKPVDNARIKSHRDIDTPKQLQNEIKLTEQSVAIVTATRQAIHQVLHQQDDRLVIVVGPCSIHDTKVAREYANKLLKYKQQFADDLIIVMRVYFEKPRTTIGWKGLVNDPYLDGSFRINEGLRLARNLLQDINHLGLPTATEYLDLISPQYIAELISWGAIGARTTESQGHRELSSGLSCPVGFKNGTDGNVQIAIDAIKAASQPHWFLSATKGGTAAAFETTGNEDCHIVLRGGPTPNYTSESVDATIKKLAQCNSQTKLMIDCSHANSNKDYRRQPIVAEAVAKQITAGNNNIMGLMIESNLVAGQQKLLKPQDLIYGQSITDACIDFVTTEKILLTLAKANQQRRKINRS